MPGVRETTNTTLQNEESGAGDFVACVETSEHINSISGGTTGGVLEQAALSFEDALEASSSVSAVPGSHPGGKLQQV